MEDLQQTVEQPQEEMDNPAWLPERLERARRGAIQNLLAELGFESAEALRQTLTDQQASITQLSQERDSVLGQAAAVDSLRRKAIIEAAFLQEAGQYDFINLDEARRLIDLDGVEVDGQNRVIGMREAVGRLVEARPHLLRRRSRVATNATTTGNASHTSADIRDMPPEQVDDIKRRFRLW
jgi:hypothetical protein